MHVIITESTPENPGLKLYHYFDGKKWVEKWEEQLEATKVVAENYSEELEPIRNQVLTGKLSPLAFHIPAHFFDIKLLASYTGIAKRHIKKHLNPENFNKLDEETLKKYAAAFGFSVEELKKV